MKYDVQLRFYGINKDGSYNEYTAKPEALDGLQDLILKSVQRSFGEDIVAISYKEPKWQTQL